jgi:HEAT repeat protein
MPARARAEAARVLGILREKDAAVAVLGALREAKDKELRKQALWSLVLMGYTEADKELAAMLDSEEDEIRYRAATGLLALHSPEVSKLVPWLSKDRNSMEVATWVLYMAWKSKPNDLKATFQEAKKTQKDEVTRNRMDEWIDYLSGVKKK